MSTTEPFITHALPDRGIDLGLDSRMQVRYDISEAEFHTFFSALKADATLQLLQEHTIGDNCYATFLQSERLLHVSYTAHSSTVRLVTDQTDRFSVPPLDPAPFAAVTATTLCVLSPDYTHREITDGNGMSYAIILPDGRYILFDGGYTQDTERLYRFLADNNRHPDGKIVIAAWIFTHSHMDHLGAFRAFAKSHAADVVLESAIFNPTLPVMFPRGKGYSAYLTETVFEDLALFGDVKCYRPRTGQIYRFCDITLEMLYTHEQHLPVTLPYMNDSSIVCRLTANGQTVLFMADCERSISDFICDMHGAALKSDVVQVNHHGYSGGTVELYSHIAPAFSLWPTNQVSFDLRVIGQKYQFIGNAVESDKYLYDTLGREHCIVADGPAKLFPLPFSSLDDATCYTYPEA
ncbi:MAG: MBL fold metallo-hydrolase [Clostridia bacterium]|nr:MBL fold metallo-hydrolase [Clostridia bacterium]